MHPKLFGSLAAAALLASPGASAHAEEQKANEEPEQFTIMRTRRGHLIVNALTRYGGLVDAPIYLGADYALRVYPLPWLGFEVGQSFLKPPVPGNLAGFQANVFDMSGTGRICFSAIVADLCPGISFTTTEVMVGDGPPNGWISHSLSLRANGFFVLAPPVAITLGLDWGWIWDAGTIAVDNRNDMVQQVSPLYFGAFLGLAYNFNVGLSKSKGNGTVQQ